MNMGTQPSTFDPRYPIGKFQPPPVFTPEIREELTAVIAGLAGQLRSAVTGLTDARLDTPYREGGWTIRQVIHHLADSHMNSFVRFKLALTENSPVIKPYDEGAWAKTPDSIGMPVGVSIDLIDALHERWAVLLRSMNEQDYAKTFVHPDRAGAMRLDFTLGIYAWHCRHHLAHIDMALGRFQAG